MSSEPPAPAASVTAPARVAVVGTGYVGLTTGACLADIGCDVVCADIDADKIARLQAGEIPIVEEGLEQVVHEAVADGRLRFVVGAAAAVADAEFVFLCVPTPQDDDGSADLSYVQAAAAEIGPVLQPGAVVINKSTVPVGSTTVVERVIRRSDVSVVSNPEFLREGTAVHDFLHPDRVVIGSSDRAAAKRLADLYAPLDAPVIITDAASAETIKYAANGFLAMKISFANAVAAMCEAVGADVEAVVAGIGSDQRIGPRFLTPGPGWGGSCFPKDTRALVAIAAQHGYDFSLMRGVISVNEQQLDRMVRKVAAAAGCGVAGYRPLEGVRVGALGLTFKAGTDDLRESPSLAILHRLAHLGAEISGYDPTAAGELDAVQQARLVGVAPAPDALSALADADVAVVLTEWPEFAELDPAKMLAAMRGSALIDTRNMFDPETMRAAGFTYEGVGRH